MDPALDFNMYSRIQPSEGWVLLLETSAREVFEVMLGTELTQMGEVEVPLTAHCTAMVGLAGRLCGVLSLRCTAETAGCMAAKMLGSEVGAAEYTIRDAIAEICNMVAGNFKTKIPGLAEGCMLSVPSVITGKHYQMHSLADGERVEVCLSFDGHPLWIGLHLDR